MNVVEINMKSAIAISSSKKAHEAMIVVAFITGNVIVAVLLYIFSITISPASYSQHISKHYEKFAAVK